MRAPQVIASAFVATAWLGCVETTKNVVNPSPPTVSAGKCSALASCYADAIEQLTAATAKVETWAPMAGPVGSVVAWPGPPDTIPAGWRICNGDSLEVARFPRLFAVVSYRYGGEGANFKLPDYRGWFLRGVNQASGHDLGVEDRGPTPGTTAAVAKDQVGTYQDSDVQPLAHLCCGNGRGGGSYPFHPDGQMDPVGVLETQKNNGKETRPANMSVYFIIRTDY